MPRIHGLVTAALTLALVCAAPSAATAQGADVLPDLNQLVPWDLNVKRVKTSSGPRLHLGFGSAAGNVGAGDLRLFGYRQARKVQRMNVNQLVTQSDSDVPRVIEDVGVMSYVVHPDHKHWHLLGFERYELRKPGPDGETIARDRKTGFCLGDRGRVPGARQLPGFSTTPLQADLCGLGQPGLTGLFVGISIGWFDNYEAHIEGQYIDITGLPSGRYVLTHTVNEDGSLAESNYSNNASSVLFRLTERRHNAAPRVQVLRRCPRTETCS